MNRNLWRIFDLPPPQQRRGGLIPYRWFHYALRLDRDIDYLCIRLTNVLLILGLALLGLMLLDIWCEAGVLFDPAEFARNKLLLPSLFSSLMGPTAFVLTVLFYLRIRLPIDICGEDIPVLAHRALLTGGTKSQWIRRSVIGISAGLISIFTTHIFVFQITGHYEMTHSLSFIIWPQLFAVVAVAAGPLFFLSYGLVLEKSLRCFPALQDNLARTNEYVNELKSATNLRRR